MIRITKEQWDAAIKNMRKDGLDLKAFGGSAGCYSIWLDTEKIMHHQFEYKEYFEIDEEFIKYAEVE